MKQSTRLTATRLPAFRQDDGTIMANRTRYVVNGDSFTVTHWLSDSRNGGCFHIEARDIATGETWAHRAFGKRSLALAWIEGASSF